MKEDVLEVLMYLFQHYISEEAVHLDRDSLQRELIEAGFLPREISRAFKWLEELAAHQANPPLPVNTGASFRIYSADETERLEVDCRGYLLFLEQAGILSSDTRELVVDRVMALDADDIDLNQLKWIVLMVLFNHPGQEQAYAWMEDLMFDEIPSTAH